VNKCINCGNESNQPLCQPCATRLATDLNTLRSSLPALREEASRRSTVVRREHGGGSRSVAPIPLNMAAFQLVHDVDEFAGMLGRALQLKYNRHMPSESLLNAASQRVPALASRKDIAHLMHVARRYAHQSVMTLTPPEDRRMVGLCPRCGRNLWLSDDEIKGGWVGCKCGQPVNVRQVQEQHLLTCSIAVDDEERHIVTTGTASAISNMLKINGIDVKRKTINEWRRRGILSPIGSQYGKPVYRVWDVWKAFTRNDSQGVANN
jgi:hypothetical protein